MPQCIISDGADLDGDDNLKAAYELVTAALRRADPETIDLRLLLDAARIASTLPVQMEGRKRDAVLLYIQTLKDPHRTIFSLRKAGKTSKQIAAKMRMDHKQVCIALAKMFSDLRALSQG